MPTERAFSCANFSVCFREEEMWYIWGTCLFPVHTYPVGLFEYVFAAVVSVSHSVLSRIIVVYCLSVFNKKTLNGKCADIHSLDTHYS